MTQFTDNKVRMVGGPASYYTEYEATSLYVEKAFGGNVNTITVTNDSATDDIQLSYDGATLETELKPGESVTLHANKTSVRIKGTAGGDHVRVWGW